MGPVTGAHHLAIQTKNMKGQLEFFTDALGTELKALYWMHGIENTLHAFLRLSDSCYLAIEFNLTDAGNEDPLPSGDEVPPRSGGSLAHISLNVDSLEDQLAIRDRLRDRGIVVVGPVDHGMCQSIYFAGLEGLMLEVATSAVPVDERAWIDPEVVGILGIEADELERMKYPASFDSQGGAVAQPMPNRYPERTIYLGAPRAFEAAAAMSDAEVFAAFSEPTPPVIVDGASAGR